MFKKLIASITIGTMFIFGGVLPTSFAASQYSPGDSQEKVNHGNSIFKTFHYYFFKSNVADKAQKPTFKKWAKEQQPEQTQNKVEQPTEQKPSTSEQTNTEKTSSALNEFEQQVVELTNVERSKNGLAPLQIDEELSKVARAKSEDMAKNNYFAHQSPTYGSPFDMMRSFGVTYKAAGENIAKGQQSPSEVVNAWMNSEGHRANILNPNFTHIGVGFVSQGNHWTQQFIGK